MAPRTNATGQLTVSQQTQIERAPATIESILKGPSMRRALEMALPKHVTADRMARVALTALTKNEKLGRCTQNSFFGSLLSAAQLGLEPNTPLNLAYLIPYGSDCQLIVGYQGMVDLAWRAGTSVRANLVREGDEFDVEYGLHQNLHHKPLFEAERESRPLKYVYAIGNPGRGLDPVFRVLSRSEVEVFRKRSKSPNSGPWATDYEPMAMKTAVRRLFPWLPKSIEVQQALALEESADRGRQSDAYDHGVIEALGSLQLTQDEPTQQPEPSAEIDRGDDPDAY